ncbi:cytochrome P450 [Microbispora sp. RL4-1S]|uniref:Cytochrome P450 n=1 Tax=Microbispora oryzae TaxID=2806554 RepID=A0A941AR58_9ACTN|nr:cytochrome P450 [Microbispora oryzae]MBP2705554.1 cytochrome P450 [Microbispora oryzae]
MTSAGTGGPGTGKAIGLPLRRILPRILRDPVNALWEFGREHRGRVIRLNLGPFRPYLVSHPDHVQRVLRLNWRNYAREGTYWKPLQRLMGDSIFSEGSWESSRSVLQPLFTAKYVASLGAGMAETITEGVENWEMHAKTGEALDAPTELTHIVTRAVVRVLFGDKIPDSDARRLTTAYHLAAKSFALRLLMPFVPNSVPVPGDRTFHRSAKVIDDIMVPLIRQARLEPGDGKDVLSALARAHAEGGTAGHQQMRDDLVAVYAAATETTGTALSWLWPLLEDHPEVAARLQAEIDDVVGPGPVDPACLPELRYTKMVLQELVRLYPSGWLLPRMTLEPDQLGDVRIPAGAQVLVSPMVTHRLDEFWDRPLDFDPERFAPGREERRSRWSYIPFGGGPRQCLGIHLFHVQAPLIVAAVLSRYRVRVASTGPYVPTPSAALASSPKIELNLRSR